MGVDITRPLSPATARREIRRIIEEGGVSYDTGDTSHFLQEARNDGLEIADCLNVLRAGTIEPAEWDSQYQEYRYRVRTPRITVVVAFISEDEVFLVTTWRNTR